MQKLYHKGVMQTMTDDCQFVCIAQQDYYRILHQVSYNTPLSLPGTFSTTPPPLTWDLLNSWHHAIQFVMS